MTVQCVDCEFADLQGARSMARHGATLCKHKDKWRFEGLTRPHECSMFKAAPEDRVAARKDWMRKEGLLA